MRSKQIAALGAVTLLGGAAYFLVVPDAPKPNSLSQQADAPPPRPPEAALPTQPGLQQAPCRFRQGDGFVHQADLDLAILVRPQAMRDALLPADQAAASRGEVQEIKAKESWTVHSRVAKVLPTGESILAFEFTDELLESAALPGGPQPVASSPVSLVQVGARCEIQRFAWKQSASIAGARRQQARLALADFALPPDKNKQEFTGSARDERGLYDYRATMAQLDGQSAVALRKAGYRSLVDKQSGKFTSERLSGNGLHVKLKAGAWFEAASRDEMTEMLQGDIVVARSVVNLKVKPAALAPKALAVDVDSAEWVWGNLLEQPAAVAAEVLDPKLVGISLADMLAKLEAMEAEGRGGYEAHQLLKAWILANQAQIPQMQAWLRNLDTNDERSKAFARKLMDALGKSGLPAARAVLRELALDKSYGPVQRVDAAMNLAGANGFDAKDLDALIALSRERAPANPSDNFAGYPAASGAAMLGMAAREQRANDPKLSELAAKELAAALQSQKDEQLLRGAIIGAGNSGDPSLLAALAPIIAGTNVEMREEAAGALKFMPMADTDQMAASWLGSESEVRVKTSLAHALWLQTQSQGKPPAAKVTQAAIAQYGQENLDVYRMELTKLLGMAAKSNPAAQAALVEQFRLELAKGSKANTDLLQAIGQYVDAAALMGQPQP